MKALAKFLFSLYRPTGMLFFAPLLIGAGLQLAANVLPRVLGNKSRQRKLDAAGQSFQTPNEFKDAANVAEGVANQGDPNFNLNQQMIQQNQANTVSRAKAITGNVSDILNTLASTNKTSTNAQMANAAQDSNFRFNAKRYLAQAKGQLGQAKQQTQQGNYQAKQAERNRQSQNIRDWGNAAGGVANDITSYSLLSNGGFLSGNPLFKGTSGTGAGMNLY